MERLKKYLQPYMPAPTEPLLKRIFIWTAFSIVFLFLACLTIFTLSVAVLSIGLPDVRNFDQLAGAESTLIYDREGGLLYAFHGEENRKYVPLSDISPALQKATIAIEDDRFYEHIGFDIPGIIKGGLHELFGIGVRRGGSTITQQLAKNAFLTPKRSYARKLRELILSVRLERAYDKDKILELYLNRIPYGNNAYGAELASQVYFGKSAKELTVGEAGVLAALPKAPTFYSPYGEYVYSKIEREFSASLLKKRNIQTVNDLRESEYTIGLIGREIQLSEDNFLYLPGRVDLVLKRMAELGVITEEEKEIAIKQTHQIEFKKYRTNIRAPHFVFYVKQLLEDQYGKDAVENGGLKIYTTIDPKLQEAAEKIVTEQIGASKELYGVTNGALAALDVKTGQVLAMVGSADYFDEAAHGSVNHVFAKRQPGSSFKPITYAKAFLNGYAPATVLYDTPTNFGAGYVPQNFEGKFMGPMPMRRALGQSRNIPAIKTYFLAGQQEEIIKLAQKMGIKTLDPVGDYGPPLAIGAGEVKLMEMVEAFSVFAANGIKRDPVFMLKTEDRTGKILHEWNEGQIRNIDVLDPQAAFLINNVLSDKSVYLGQRLDVAGHATAAKTGTSNKEITPVKILPSNLWTIGYTPSISAGAWAGNSDGSPTKLGADGYNVAAPMWAKFMAEALKDKPNEPFSQPKGIKYVEVSKTSGKLKSAVTPKDQIVNEVFASWSIPTEADDMFVEVAVNKLDGKLPSQYTPQEYIKKRLFINHHDPINTFPLWGFGIKQWIAEKIKEDPAYLDFPPSGESAMFTAENAGKEPTVRILMPSAFTEFNKGLHGVTAEFTAPNKFKKAEFYLDDKLMATDRKPENGVVTGKIRVTAFMKDGQTLLTVRVFDEIGYIGRASVEVKVKK